MPEPDVPTPAKTPDQRWQRARILPVPGVHTEWPPGFELWVKPAVRLPCGQARHLADPKKIVSYESGPVFYLTEYDGPMGYGPIYQAAQLIELLGHEPEHFTDEVPRRRWTGMPASH